MAHVPSTALRGLAESWVPADDGRELFAELATHLRSVVPFDGSAWFATDPSTELATNPVRIENVRPGHCVSYWEREYSEPDAMLFRDLARSRTSADSLFHATENRPERSARYREFLAPQGYGDEVRAVFQVSGTTWGVVDLFREAGRSAFTAREVETIAAVGSVIATALRSFATFTAPGTLGAAVDGPGTALVEADGSFSSLDDQADRWLRELAGPDWSAKEPPPLMVAVQAVVARAKAVSTGRDRGAATARLRATTGRWLQVHASCLRTPDGQPGLTAVVIEPAKSVQIAPIIVEAYGLTPREREITQALARGLSNAEIAASLFLSSHTVRDHLKAVFTKLGVVSRGEVVAKLFADHYEPALHSVPFDEVHESV